MTAYTERRAGLAPWPTFLAENAQVLSIAAFFLACIAAFPVADAPPSLTAGNLLNMLRQSAPILIVAVAMTFVITTGGIDLSVGSTVALVNALAAIALAAGMPWLAGRRADAGRSGALIGARAGLVHRLSRASRPSSSRWRACRSCAALRCD